MDKHHWEAQRYTLISYNVFQETSYLTNLLRPIIKFPKASIFIGTCIICPLIRNSIQCPPITKARVVLLTKLICYWISILFLYIYKPPQSSLSPPIKTWSSFTNHCKKFIHCIQRPYHRTPFILLLNSMLLNLLYLDKI